MKILVTGRNGQVGFELERSLQPLGEVIAVDRNRMDLADLDQVRYVVREANPDVIVNAAAYTAVDKAESDPELAMRINGEAPGVLAEEAARSGAAIVHYSTDYVFDGSKASPYLEDDLTMPLSVYGATKRDGEQLIQHSGCRHIILRTSWVYAARGANFAKTMLRLGREREEIRVVADQIGAPTSAELIADVTALILYRLGLDSQAASGYSGIYHLTASGQTSWHGYAKFVLEQARSAGLELKVSPDGLHAIPSEAYPLPAMRPKNSRMNTAKLTDTFHLQLPDWTFHVRRMMQELSVQGN